MSDWLFCILIVTGDQAQIDTMKKTAEGAAGIPWYYPDLPNLDEEFLAKLIMPPDGSAGLGLHDAKVLTRLLRSAVETHHGQVLTAANISHAYPFSLHRLLPVPAAILRLGPDDPVSRTWLCDHWGTDAALRQVRVRPEPPSRRPRRFARVSYDFWSAGNPPTAAITNLSSLWPGLAFDLRQKTDP